MSSPQVNTFYDPQDEMFVIEFVDDDLFKPLPETDKHSWGMFTHGVCCLNYSGHLTFERIGIKEGQIGCEKENLAWAIGKAARRIQWFAEVSRERSHEKKLLVSGWILRCQCISEILTNQQSQLAEALAISYQQCATQKKMGI